MATLNPTSVTLSPGTQGASTLTITTTNTISNSYTVSVTGSSPSHTDSVNVPVTVPFPNDQFYPSQWGPVDLNLSSAWHDHTVGNKLRIVAIVDTGVDLVHPDLQANLWTAPDGSHGWDCYNNDNIPVDDNGHGTKVAGVAAAVINNALGVAGTAQEWIMPIKVTNALGQSNGSFIACGIRWAVDHGANVINLSLGQAASVFLEDAVRYAWGQGALLVASAGNNEGEKVECPACYDEVIAVSALQPGHTLANFSNYGPKIELSAPGTNIYTTGSSTTPPLPRACHDPFALYCGLGNNGTSFAAPFVSGIAALAWDYEISRSGAALTNQNIRDALDTYVADLGPTGREEKFGFGEPDVPLLLANMVSVHTYRLSAIFDCCFISGPEAAAKVWVHDDTTHTYLINGLPVGESGLTIYVTTGHVITLQFQGYNVECFNDGTRNVLLRATVGIGGTPSSFGSYPQTFVFPAMNASSEGHYNTVSIC